MINGIIVIDKPKNVTSRDIVNKVGTLLHTKKVGHTGTLDPLATGVLVLTVGKATKISEILTASKKEYIAEVILGIETDTLDITGNILKEENTNYTKEQIEEVLLSFIGTYTQEVPIYSAIKVNGKKLYEYARNKENVILPKKEVTIEEIKLIHLSNENEKTHFSFSCIVSKGTYIRSLIRDIANKLNTIGTMANLRRVCQGDFKIENSYKMEDIEKGTYQIISIPEVFKNIKQIEMDEELEKKIKNGMQIKNLYNEDYILFYKENCYALYKKETDILKPYKMLL